MSLYEWSFCCACYSAALRLPATPLVRLALMLGVPRWERARGRA